MIDNLPAIPAGSLAAARQAEQDALRADADPWVRADAAAAQWLRNPRFSPGTKDQYRLIYMAWRVWCVGIDVPPLDARRSDLEAYTVALEKIGNPAAQKPRPLSRRSIARHMAAISSFYKRAISDELTDRNPVPPSDRPKISRRSRQPHLTPKEIRSLIAAADRHSPRSSALVALLVLACLRISEALNATVEDLTRESGTDFLWITRKGDKGEKVPLPPEAHARVAAAIAGRREGPILVTAGGKRLDRKAAWETVRRLGERAGIGTPIGPHTLRHAYITRGHEMQLPVADLQDAAGHSSVDTTRGYDRSQFDPGRHPSFKIARDLAGAPSRASVTGADRG